MLEAILSCRRMRTSKRFLYVCLVCVLLTVLQLVQRYRKKSFDVAFVDASWSYETHNAVYMGDTTQRNTGVTERIFGNGSVRREFGMLPVEIHHTNNMSNPDEGIQRINNDWKSLKLEYKPARHSAVGYGKLFNFDVRGLSKISTPPVNNNMSAVDAPFVVILGQWRFGSSIVGQIFNQNPAFFFMYEPLWIVDHLRNIGKLPLDFFSPQRRKYSDSVLKSIVKCNFSPEYVAVTNTWTGIYNNNVLCSLRPGSRCRLPSPKWLGKLCSMFNGRVAIKVIRADLENIRPLIVEDKLNVKVIHLVRDPRGSAASRIRYYFKLYRRSVSQHRGEFATYGRLAPLGLMNTTLKPKDSITRMCSWVRENLRNSSNLPDWLQGRYFLLKYEDFAEAPLKVTEDLYDFVNMPLPDRVRKWVDINTQVVRSNSGTFDVRKNSRVMAKRWMSELSLLEIAQVESACSDVMELLGYKRYVEGKP